MAKPTLQPLAALNLGEISDIAAALQPMVGSQLQECLTSQSQAKTEVGLGFYHRGQTTWLWFDLDPQRPMIVRSIGAPPSRKKTMRPLALFIRSRYLGRRLQSVTADLARGRVLIFCFHRAESEGEAPPIEIEVRLLPHAPNVIARDGTTSVAENKPKELPEGAFSLPPEAERRTWDEIETAWRAQGAKTSTDPEAKRKDWLRALEKKREAVQKMALEIESKAANPSRDVGEWLKAHGSLEVPDQWASLVDRANSLSWNIENSFRLAKGHDRKLDGSRVRLEKLRSEIASYEAKGPPTQRTQETERDSLLLKAEAKGRSLKLAADLDCYIGKSAADNLAILRRAQPFDLWLHLREIPGSHAIIRRARGRVVSDQELAEAGRWVATQSFGKRAASMKGERFDLLVVECRFVRPIKGDKLGRVNYTHDRVIRVQL